MRPPISMTRFLNCGRQFEIASRSRTSALDGEAPVAVEITAEHVGDLGMAAASDEAILQAGRDRQAVIVTLDADFHQLLAVTNAVTPSVVRIRMEGLKGDQLAQVLALVIAQAWGELAAGAVVSCRRDADSRSPAADWSLSLRGMPGRTLVRSIDQSGSFMYSKV